MEFSYSTDDGQELDEGTFWAYVRLKVKEFYISDGAREIQHLYDVNYWGDSGFSTDILEKIINYELNKLLNNES